MPKRDTVQPNVDSIAEKVSAKSWSEASFSKMIGKHKRWLSEVRRGKNLPSPEEAARICQLLKATPDEILLREGETPEATAKCLENIETVRKLIEGVDDKIAQFIRSASADELTEISRYIEYLESKRDKT